MWVDNRWFGERVWRRRRGKGRRRLSDAMDVYAMKIRVKPEDGFERSTVEIYSTGRKTAVYMRNYE